jgi:phosphate transport system permease protein
MKAAGWKRRLSPTRLLAYGFSALTLAIVGSALAMFLWQSFPVWRHEGLGYLTGKQWHYRGQQFGALPMIYGSVVVSVLALLWFLAVFSG